MSTKGSVIVCKWISGIWVDSRQFLYKVEGVTVPCIVHPLVTLCMSLCINSPFCAQVPSCRCDLRGGGSVGDEVQEGCTGGGVDTQLSFLEGLPFSCEGRLLECAGICACASV